MGDTYATFTNTGLGRTVVRRLGLPDPPRLRRHEPGAPLAPGPVLLGAAPGGRLGCPVRDLLDRAGTDVRGGVESGTRYGALIFDATGILDSAGLRALYDFFHPAARSVLGS
ncbi:short chain dehydrogenase, partial [Actinoplanes sp. NPDC048791]